MPPKRRNSRRASSDDNDETQSTTQRSMTMTEDQLSTLVQSILRSQADANRILAENLLSTDRARDATPHAFTPPFHNPVGATFAKCTARFHGLAPNDPESLEAFIDSITMYKECMSISDEHAVRGLAMLLTDDAAVWWRGVKDTITDWPQALTRLRSMYGAPRPAHRIFREIFAAEQRDDARADSFVTHIRALLAKLPYKLDIVVQLDIIYSLLHKRIKKRIPREECGDVDDLIRRAREVEESILEYKSSPSGASEPVSARSVTKIVSTLPTNDCTTKPKNRRVKCSFCRNFGHSIDACRKRADSVSQPDKLVASPASSSVKSSDNPIRCYGCGQIGVIKSKCSVCREVSSVKLDTPPAVFQSAITDDITAVQRAVVHVTVADQQGLAILDSGATHSIASASLYEVLKRSGTTFTESQRSIILADGSRLVSKFQIGDTFITIGGCTLPISFMVLPEATNNRTLLGLDFITRAGIVINAPQGSWNFVSEPQAVHPFARDDISHLSNEQTLLTLQEEQMIALREDEGIQLNTEQRLQVNALLLKFHRVFDEEGPPTEYAVHCIKVKDDQIPIASPPYRMSQSKKELLHTELQKLLHADIIEECESPWSANVVLVDKKDGGVRLCVDYRRLNAVTEPDRYPLPRIEDVLHAAKSSNFMTTLDLRSGYFQTTLRPEDRDKSAFTTPLGTYRFKRMPMGLCNSGATFQRLIDRFKSNLTNVHILGYLDDLIILSDSFERHLADLEAVFERLRMFNLRVHRQKSCFARDSVRFLGHVIVPGGLAADEEKVAALLNVLPPQNVKHLKSFIQTTSWFRRFIPNYAETAKPLTDLLKKNVSWHWSEHQQQSFDALKSALTNAPVLIQADGSKPYVLRTDSSGYALGAALMQGDGADERPVEYASRLLTHAERNYSTTEREALAVVWAVQKFRGYIEGSRVVVKSDHQPLKWLMGLRSPSGRLARWALILQEYNLQIDYTPGRSNVLADMLSRPTCGNSTDCDLCHAAVDIPVRSSADVRENQLRDADIKKIIDDMDSHDVTRGRVWAEKGFIVVEGVLFRYSLEPNDEEAACLVVPTHEREQILKEYHDAPTAGHLGVERTLQRISKRYYWPGMRASVAQHVKECVPCQRYKIDNRKPAGLVQTPAMARRFEVVSIDLFGPLPETADGNKWILVIEDTCSRWIELFALKQATSTDCAKIFITEICLRYGVPRRLLSDNGVQFVSEIMQQVCHSLGISQSLTPVYHPQANPVERKNRDIKTQLAILVGRDHNVWDSCLAAVRFAMNSATTASTGQSPAYLTFGRELRTPGDANRDMRAIVEGDNVLLTITPYLRHMSIALDEARDVRENLQQECKEHADGSRRPAPEYKEGDLVLLKTHGANDAIRGQTPKFLPRRDGPYRVHAACSPVSYILERVTDNVIIGKYHTSHITPYVGHIQTPLQEKRKRGRPRKPRL